jgi:hypothetical protein
MDFFLGVIIVSVCVGVINGAVYGWLFFGLVLILSGIIQTIVGKIK